MVRLTPQQRLFKKYYLNPTSSTFGNAYQSALKAGFEENYAKVITAQNLDWFNEILRDQEMLDLAEEALKEAVQYDVRNGGEKVDPSVASIKAKSAQFVASTLGKEKYASRQELTGADGEALVTPPEVVEKVTKALDDFFSQRDSN